MTAHWDTSRDAGGAGPCRLDPTRGSSYLEVRCSCGWSTRVYHHWCCDTCCDPNHVRVEAGDQLEWRRRLITAHIRAAASIVNGQEALL